MKLLNIECFFDGSCWPNPGGKCQAGVVIYRGKKKIHESTYLVGTGPEMSNNVGEYVGLLVGMLWLLRKNLNHLPVVFKGDSLLVVNQMSGESRAHRGLYLMYHKEAIELKKQFPKIFFKWIPREDNSEADGLSKRKGKYD